MEKKAGAEEHSPFPAGSWQAILLQMPGTEAGQSEDNKVRIY